MVDNSSTMPQTVGEENGEKRRECALSHAIPNEERKRGGRNKDYFESCQIDWCDQSLCRAKLSDVTQSDMHSTASTCGGPTWH
jgi:hypothetical protein